MTFFKRSIKKNKKYRFKKELETILDSFSAGEEVIFSDESYSCYDGATIYTFFVPADGSYKQAFVSDKEDIEIVDYLGAP